MCLYICVCACVCIFVFLCLPGGVLCLYMFESVCVNEYVCTPNLSTLHLQTIKIEMHKYQINLHSLPCNIVISSWLSALLKITSSSISSEP